MSQALKEAIVTVLSQKQQIGMDCDLACYQDNDGFFHVDYLYSEDTVDVLNLDEQQKKIIHDEEELLEIFETPEEAADFYLKLTNGRIDLCNSYRPKKGKKRTLEEKVNAFDKDMYF